MADCETPTSAPEPTDPDSAPISQPPVTVGFTRVTSYRVTEIRRNSGPPPANDALLRLVADLLMAAACSDGEACQRERHALRKIQARLSGGVVPPWLDAHIANFDPRSFDLAATTQRLRELPLEHRRHIAELVREICDANDAFDIEEERFLISVIFALALDPTEHEDLVVPSELDQTARDRTLLSKRCFDAIFAFWVLVILSPLLFTIALAVKLSSPGNVLFKQRRYGKDGAIIEVFKFRSMRAMENGAVVNQAKRSDPRVTRVGAFLRRTSLDELPQFYNVLRGDMSVVGPRPHAVAHNEQHRTLILEYMLRHKVKPGITGLAQVNGFRGETDTLEKMIRRVECDLAYIRQYSFWLDLKIIWLTVFGRKVRSNAY